MDSAQGAGTEALMKTTPRSETEARKAARPVLLRTGWHDGEFREAAERQSKRGNDMIEVVVAVREGDGNEREFRDYLTDAGMGALKLRHACMAVGVLDKYEAGEIGAADFPGHACRVKLGVEKKRGYPDRNVIEDYAASSVVALQAVS
jgi:hypothetical protein